MKRLLGYAAVLIFAAVAAVPTFAQGNPALGTWKLNTAKSKFTGAPMPKELTRTLEADGDAVKYTFSGTAADGSALSYGFTEKYDGKDSAMTGNPPGGIEAVNIKKVTAHHYTVMQKKGGKEVSHGSANVSKDGKVTMVMLKGTNAEGKPFSTSSEYDKQ
jgi:hypothetical protein